MLVKYCYFSHFPYYKDLIKFCAILNNSHPHLWYPNAREKKRKVFLHVGPTNSGKTHNALKRLEASTSGTTLIYPSETERA
jgi:ATP-dependent RNA helicase SUPV3L1/SUV3